VFEAGAALARLVDARHEGLWRPADAAALAAASATTAARAALAPRASTLARASSALAALTAALTLAAWAAALPASEPTARTADAALAAAALPAADAPDPALKAALAAADARLKAPLAAAAANSALEAALAAALAGAARLPGARRIGDPIPDAAFQLPALAELLPDQHIFARDLADPLALAFAPQFQGARLAHGAIADRLAARRLEQHFLNGAAAAPIGLNGRAPGDDFRSGRQQHPVIGKKLSGGREFAALEQIGEILLKSVYCRARLRIDDHSGLLMNCRATRDIGFCLAIKGGAGQRARDRVVTVEHEAHLNRAAIRAVEAQRLAHQRFSRPRIGMRDLNRTIESLRPQSGLRKRRRRERS
jgi:hypothetical protein